MRYLIFQFCNLFHSLNHLREIRQKLFSAYVCFSEIDFPESCLGTSFHENLMLTRLSCQIAKVCRPGTFRANIFVGILRGLDERNRVICREKATTFSNFFTAEMIPRGISTKTSSFVSSAPDWTFSQVTHDIDC